MGEYQKLGASADKAGLHTALKKSGLGASGNLFCSVGPEKNGHYSFLHCDGAGTKSIVAYLAYKETGNSSYFAGLAADALVMNLDDVFCLGPVKELSLANLIARNYHQIPDEALVALFESYKSLTKTLASHGVEIELAGGETADCGDVVRTLLVDAVLSGKIEKDKLINLSNIKPGDVIVGLHSTGHASYEEKENSGIGSNGLTLARHALIHKKYQEKYPEIREPHTPESRGRAELFEKIEGSSLSRAEALLSPTKTFAPVLSSLYSKHLDKVSGVIHNTGGAHTKVSKFAPEVSIHKTLGAAPPVFALIKEEGDVQWQEMYKVFNMGVRMEVYTDQDTAKSLIEIASGFNVEATVIGKVTEQQDYKVKLDTPYGEFTY